ncbi:hypothetical protein JOC37_000421 [Desulfohalotomaculum tongense]|uniref:DUF3243 domain-containing protein n=1 Tax=Desulforadius tongensis TaxID=1216062 RepID=UPI0019560DA4|nr:DUF3243 domain-containing protein [Desulforadius tongensis]MBM7854049.1 hypothetical protein [Desulforadius tongensis]
MELGTNWHKWKDVLGEAVQIGEKLGLSHDNIDDIAYRLGQFLANNLDPANKEQRLLKELWENGTEEEKRSLASMMAKMSKRDSLH